MDAIIPKCSFLMPFCAVHVCGIALLDGLVKSWTSQAMNYAVLESKYSARSHFHCVEIALFADKI
jgi:hypothetical protein